MKIAFIILAILSGPAQAQTQFNVQNQGDEIIITSTGTPEPQPVESTVLSTISTWPVADLSTYFVASMDNDEKITVLERIRQTPPRTAQDIRALLNLYSRFPEARAQAEQSLLRLSPQAREFGPYFVNLIRDEDPFFQMFGLSGAYRLRFEPALEPIRKLAEQKFAHPRPSLDLLPGEFNAWQSQYAALRVLALWEGRSALPLILKKAKEAPQAAALAGAFFWEEAFDQIVAWAKSSKPEDAERALAAWSAETPAEALRRTWPRLEKLVLDKSSKPELRHRAALKLGLASGPDEVEALLKEREARRKDERTRVLLDAALFASRSPKAVPILEEYARTHPNALSRAGALLQLRGMLEPPRYAELLRWAAANDPDEENRASARLELERLGRKD